MAFPITGALTVIGREAGNLIQLSHPKVSKRHAVIKAGANEWMIEDLDSTNGLSVNGARVKRSSLTDGDRVLIGPFDLVFETLSDRDEWVPTHVIDLSSQVLQRTITQDPKRSA